jgi:hypothetical protein
LSKVVRSDLQHLSSNGVAYLEDGTEDKGALFTVEATTTELRKRFWPKIFRERLRKGNATLNRKK